jgi:pullulanase
MKKYFMLLGFLTHLFGAKAQQNDPLAIGFAKYPVYTGTDLGLSYSPKQSVFRIWAPSAMEAQLRIFPYPDIGNFTEIFPMKKDKNGTWVFTWPGDHKGLYYTFSVFINMKWLNDVPDPYANLVGVNGRRALIADLNETDPAGWEKIKVLPFKNGCGDL